MGAGPQQPVNLVQLYQAAGLDVQLDVDLGSSPALLPDGPDEQLRANEAASLYVGDHQARSVSLWRQCHFGLEWKAEGTLRNYGQN